MTTMSDAEVNAALARAIGWRWMKHPDDDAMDFVHPGDIADRQEAGCQFVEYLPGMRVGNASRRMPDFVGDARDSAALEDELHRRGFDVSSQCAPSRGRWEMWVQVIGFAPLFDKMEITFLESGETASAVRRRLLALAAHAALCGSEEK